MKLNIKVIASLLLISMIFVPIHAIARGCPAFTSSMIDGAFLATEYNQEEPVSGIAVDYPYIPGLFCEFVNQDGGYYVVFVGYHDSDVNPGNKAHLYARSPRVRNTILRTYVYDLSEAEMHACRAQVMGSFVWKQYCRPLMN